jgi:hypothetical protein
LCRAFSETRLEQNDLTAVPKEDRSEFLRSLIARLEASPEAGVDETFLQDIESLSPEERQELARMLFERESNAKTLDEVEAPD